MKIDPDTQRKIAVFLPDALEHAINLYNEQKNNAPTDIVDIDPEDPLLATGIPTPPKSVSRKNPKTSDPFEQYLGRLKGCLGQIEVLSKLSATLAQNNMFSDAEEARHKELLRQGETLKQALQDMPNLMQALANTHPTDPTHHDPDRFH